MPLRNSTFGYENISKQLKNAVGAMSFLTVVMLGWPPAVVQLSKFVNSTPVDSTAAVHIENGVVEVNIPQTYAKFRKEEEEDD